MPTTQTAVQPAGPSLVPATKTKISPAQALEVYTGDPNFMASLARGLVVIQAFTPQTPQMTISQLAVRTGLSRAAVRRCSIRSPSSASPAPMKHSVTRFVRRC